jgi:hypothetical protein
VRHPDRVRACSALHCLLGLEHLNMPHNAWQIHVITVLNPDQSNESL